MMPSVHNGIAQDAHRTRVAPAVEKWGGGSHFGLESAPNALCAAFCAIPARRGRTLHIRRQHPRRQPTFRLVGRRASPLVPFVVRRMSYLTSHRMAISRKVSKTPSAPKGTTP